MPFGYNGWRKIRAGFLFALICFAFGATNLKDAFASVQLNREQATSRIADPKVRSFLERHQLGLAQTERFPELKLFQQQVAEMVERLRPTDGPFSSGNIEVILVDSMRVFAGIDGAEEGADTHKLIISLGTLAEAASDDEVAMVIAHEFAHGVTSISKVEAEMKAKHQSSTADRIFLKKLQRVEETEVDVRALEIMHKAKFNPYAAEDLFKTLDRLYGLSTGSQHPIPAARRNAISAALTGMRRVGGREIADTAQKETTLVKRAKEFLGGPKYLSYRMAEIRKVTTQSVPDFQVYLRKLQTTAGQKAYQKQIQTNRHDPELDPFNKLANQFSERIQNLAGSKLSHAELQEFEVLSDLNLEVQRNRAFEGIKKSKIANPISAPVIAQHFQTTTESRLYGTHGQHLRVVNVGSELANTAEEVTQVNSELLQFERTGSPDLADKRLAATSKLKMLHGRLERLRTEFQFLVGKMNANGKHGSVLPILTEAIEINRKLVGGDQIPKRLIELETKLQDYLKPSLVEPGRLAQKTRITSLVDVILDGDMPFDLDSAYSEHTSAYLIKSAILKDPSLKESLNFDARLTRAIERLASTAKAGPKAAGLSPQDFINVGLGYQTRLAHFNEIPGLKLDPGKSSDLVLDLLTTAIRENDDPKLLPLLVPKFQDLHETVSGAIVKNSVILDRRYQSVLKSPLLIKEISSSVEKLAKTDFLRTLTIPELTAYSRRLFEELSFIAQENAGSSNKQIEVTAARLADRIEDIYSAKLLTKYAAAEAKELASAMTRIQFGEQLVGLKIVTPEQSRLAIDALPKLLQVKEFRETVPVGSIVKHVRNQQLPDPIGTVARIVRQSAGAIGSATSQRRLEKQQATDIVLVRQLLTESGKASSLPDGLYQNLVRIPESFNVPDETREAITSNYSETPEKVLSQKLDQILKSQNMSIADKVTEARKALESWMNWVGPDLGTYLLTDRYNTVLTL